MQIELVSHPEVAILRWHQLVDDPELAKLPYRIETDRFGRILISHEHRPASGGVVNLSLITPRDSSVMIVSIVVQVVGTKMALTANPGISYFAIHFSNLTFTGGHAH